MKGLDKLTCIRLAETLTQRSNVESEIITDSLYAQDQHGESFVESLLASDKIGEWDLAKLVADTFQVPFLMAGTYDISDEAKKVIPEELLFEHSIVPLDKFDDVLTIVMPVLTPFETLAKVKAATQCVLCPFVGLVTENKKVLADQFEGYKEWRKEFEAKRDQDRQERTAARTGGGAGDSEWMNIFDSADAQVRDALGNPK